MYVVCSKTDVVNEDVRHALTGFLPFSGRVNANFFVYYAKKISCTQKCSSFAYGVRKIFEVCGEECLKLLTA